MIISFCLEPLSSQPAVEEVDGRFRLVHGHHVTCTVDLHEGEVATGLDLAVFLRVPVNLERLNLSLLETLLARPLESVGPSLVAEPVADEVGITSINQDRDLLQDAGNHMMVRLHPVTGKKEVAVDVHVAAVIAINFSTKSFLDIILVKVIRDVAKARVAQIAAILAVASNIIDISTGALVRSHHRVVAVDASGNARPGAARLVAGLDERLASGKGIVHAAALALAEDRRIATLTTSHGTVVSILSVAIGKTIADQNTLEVDVTVLVGEDLRCEDGNVVASIRLSSNVEVLLSVFGELVEEEGEKSINVLASSHSVANRAAAVRVANVDGLVKEDDGSIVVPRMRVVNDVKLLVNRSRTKLKE